MTTTAAAMVAARVATAQEALRVDVPAGPLAQGGEMETRSLASSVADWPARAAAAVRARPALTRWLLAGPGAVVAAVAFLMAAPLWLPEGAAG